MGLCCGGVKKGGKPDGKYKPEPEAIPKILKKGESAASKGDKKGCQIWGDSFDSQTLALLACLDYCHESFQYNEVNMFTGEHTEDTFVEEVNPTGLVLTLKNGNDSVLGGIQLHLGYLADNFAGVSKQLYPAAKINDINKHILWYQSNLRPVAQMIVKQVVGPKAFGERECSPQQKMAT